MAVSSDEDREDFIFVQRLVKERTGIRLADEARSTLWWRLRPKCLSDDIGSLSELVHRIRRSPDELLVRRIVQAVVNHETMFFRDSHPFRALGTLFANELQQRVSAGGEILIWSAGCASGQEPYSIAIMLREQCTQTVLRRVRIIGSDLSSAVLTRARDAWYTDFEVQRGLSAAYRERYFRFEGNGWKLYPQIAEMVQFHELNLVHHWPSLPSADIVFLRNVLIYFDAQTRETVLARIHERMRPGGYLVLGASETMLQLETRFVPVRIDGSLVYQSAADVPVLRSKCAASRPDTRFSGGDKPGPWLHRRTNE